MPNGGCIYPNIHQNLQSLRRRTGSRGPPNPTAQHPTMNSYLKTAVLAIVLSVATSLQAESPRLDLGATSEVDIEIDHVTNHSYEVRLYDNGNLAFVFDAGGVTFAASGITYYPVSSSWYGFTVQGFTGNVSGSISTYNEGQGSYNEYSGGNPSSLSWTNGWSQWIYAYFWP